MDKMPSGKSKEDAAKESLKIADKVFEDLDRYYNQFSTNWESAERAVYGDIWNNNPEYRPYDNHSFEMIEGITAILTDSDPVLSVKTDDPTKQEQVQSLQQAMEWVFKDQCLIMKRTEAIRNGLISAPGYIFKWYDHNACNGDGADVLEVLERDQVRLDGGCRDIHSARKAVICVDRDKEWLKLRYPSKAKIIDKLAGKKDSPEKNNRARETKDTRGEHRNSPPPKYSDDELLELRIVYKKDYSTVKIPEKETMAELMEEKKSLEKNESPDVNKWQDHDKHIEAHVAELVEMYSKFNLTPEDGIDAVMDFAEQAGEQSLAMGGEDASVDFTADILKIKILEDHITAHGLLKKQNPKGEKLKYRGAWRVIESIDKHLMRDGEHEHDHLRIPLAVYYGNKDRCIYGHSEMSKLYDTETMRAVMAYKEYKGLQRVANPSLLISYDSQLDPEDVTNEDGGKYLVEDIDRSLRFLQPGQVSEQVNNFQAKKLEGLKQISGMREPTQGDSPHPNASGHAIARLQNQSIGRFRLKTRLFESHSDPSLAYLVASDIIQFWHNEKILELQEENGELKQVVFNPMDMDDLKWKVEMQAGSMAGIDKDAFNSHLYNMALQGFIPKVAYIANAELPKKARLLEAVEGQNEVIQQAQAQVEEATAMAEQASLETQSLQLENLKLKAQLEPVVQQELLRSEERKILEEAAIQEVNEQIIENEQPEMGLEQEIM